MSMGGTTKNIIYTFGFCTAQGTKVSTCTAVVADSDKEPLSI